MFDWILLGGPPCVTSTVFYCSVYAAASLWSPQRLGSVTFTDVSVSLTHTWISREQIWKGIQPSNSAHTINCERHLYDYSLFTKYSSLVFVAFFRQHLPICFHVPDSKRNEVMATVSTLTPEPKHQALYFTFIKLTPQRGRALSSLEVTWETGSAHVLSHCESGAAAFSLTPISFKTFF